MKNPPDAQNSVRKRIFHVHDEWVTIGGKRSRYMNIERCVNEVPTDRGRRFSSPVTSRSRYTYSR